ncbi:TolC family protein [Proteiniphilum sp. X52]|uniref:TolC family protein n=1 Tax=Proteiniphilum sp. X52 TaxID=2382159 RepID=UPI000F09E5E6|nr:TolC family protein [Proteiniphilum sp. X52]RNC65300.1 TolC family protein [Proteiniphilum sp. X52]
MRYIFYPFFPVRTNIASVCITAAVFLLSGISAAYSQEKALPSQWDLQACIDYALENNIQIKKSEANKETGLVDTKLAKAAMLPSLSASIGQNLTNYPFSQENTSSGTSSLSTSGSYSLNASWTIFDGGSRVTGIKQAELNNRIADLEIEESKNNIKLSIIQNYLQILYASEALKAYEDAVELSKAQLESNKIKLSVGSVAKSDVSQWESQFAADNYNLVNAQTTLENYKLQLKQLLELDSLDSMDLTLTPPGEEDVLSLVPDKQTIYQTALHVMPQIRNSELNTEYAQLGIEKAKAGFYPTVSLQVNTGTANLYNQSGYSFGSQLKNNWNNMIGLSVSIPIFSNRTVKSAVEKAGINVYSSQLNELSIRKELYADIETAYLNTLASQAQFVAAEEKVKYSRESYDVMNEQFTLGLKNTIEMLTEKNRLITAQQELLQAKYKALLNIKVLEYYQGLI